MRRANWAVNPILAIVRALQIVGVCIFFFDIAHAQPVDVDVARFDRIARPRRDRIRAVKVAEFDRLAVLQDEDILLGQAEALLFGIAWREDFQCRAIAQSD